MDRADHGQRAQNLSKLESRMVNRVPESASRGAWDGRFLCSNTAIQKITIKQGMGGILLASFRPDQMLEAYNMQSYHTCTFVRLLLTSNLQYIRLQTRQLSTVLGLRYNQDTI